MSTTAIAALEFPKKLDDWSEYGYFAEARRKRVESALFLAPYGFYFSAPLSTAARMALTSGRPSPATTRRSSMNGLCRAIITPRASGQTSLWCERT